METIKMSESKEVVDIQSTSDSEPKEKIDFNNFVLTPDHPLLEPFQRALKEHLQIQIARIKEDLYEIEDDVKRKETEIVDVGVQAYEVQQQVCYQQRVLDNLINKIQKVSEDQEKEELELEKNTKDLKELQNKLFQTEKNNREMVVEIDSVTALNQHLLESETKIESHITINKRIADKSRQENDQLAKEKRRQDYLIHYLLTDIWNLETEIETSKLQISLKEEELEDLEQRSALGNTNITALQSELKALMFSWTSVVAAVSNRDKGLECLNQELNKQQERHKDVLTEIGQSKKEIKKEQLEHQTFTALKERVLEDIKMSQGQIEEQIALKKSLDEEVHSVKMVIDRLDSDIKVCKQESHMKTLAYNKIEQDYKRMAARKYKIDQEIFKCIQGEIENDVYGKKAKKMLKDLADKKRDVEVILNEVENKKSGLHSEIESQKFKIEELTRINEETKEEMGKLDEVARKMKTEIEKFELLYRKKEKHVLTLNEKLEQKLAAKDLDKIARAEMKIIDLTKLTEECQQAIKSLQVFWMREQKNILAVAKDRQEQIHNISVLRKQVLILEQKNVRMCDEIEELRKNEEKTQHRINVLTNKTAILCEWVNNKKNKKQNLDKSNTLLQNEFESKLKEAELEVLKLEGDIADIEDDKLNLSKELIDINREGLEWEKKFHMTKEFVNKNNKFGEVNNMRQEIHKMEVIYGGLKKSQDKLVRELKNCVWRRDALYFESDVRQKTEKSKKNADKIRINFQKKLDNIKNQIKQVKTETQSMKSKYKHAEDKIKEMNKQIEIMLKEPVFNKDYKGLLRHKLDEMKINRQLKFELLVFKQRKANMHSLIAKNRIPFTLYKKDEDLILEYQKAKEINNKLLKIADDLKLSFKDKANDFIRMRNTLSIVALCMYTSNLLVINVQ